MLLYQPFGAHGTGQIAHGRTDGAGRGIGRGAGVQAGAGVGGTPFGEGVLGQRGDGQMAARRQQRGQPAQPAFRSPNHCTARLEQMRS